MSILRKTSAIALMIAMGGATAHAETKPATKDIVIVHGALVDASGWRAVYDLLSKDGFHVTIVQEPLTGLAEDIEATNAPSTSRRALLCSSATAMRAL
jgi:hypothetical protein